MNHLPTGRLVQLLMLAGALVPGCADADRTSAPAVAIVGPDGGVVSGSGAAVRVPPGALGAQVELAVGAATAPTPLPAGLQAAGGVFTFTPHGQAFATPVTITLPYSGSAGGLAVRRLDDPSDDGWDVAPEATFSDGIAQVPTDRFSLYVVTRPAPAPAGVVATLPIPGGQPGALLVNADHDVVVFDRDISDDGRPQLRFLAVTDAAGAVELAPETVDILTTTGIPRGWMAHDRHHGLIYVLARRDRTNNANLRWDQMRVHVISGRGQLASFIYNPDGGEPLLEPQDFRYQVGGFTLKEANAEAGDPTRLFIDDTLKGHIDVLELDATGTAVASQQRVSYRDRWESGCQWPPEPAPWQCNWPANAGNTLALEWRFETAPNGGLQDHDLLYIADHIYSETRIRVFEVAQAGPNLGLRALPDVDMELAEDLFANGVEGLTLAGPADTLYVATGLQTYDDGLLGSVDTRTQVPSVIVTPFSDRGAIAVDPSDPNRIFVATTDRHTEDAPLFVQVIEQGTVVRSVLVRDRHREARVRGMAYDPAFQLLYLTVEDAVVVVRTGS